MSPLFFLAEFYAFGMLYERRGLERSVVGGDEASSELLAGHARYAPGSEGIDIEDRIANFHHGVTKGKGRRCRYGYQKKIEKALVKKRSGSGISGRVYVSTPGKTWRC